MKVGMGSIFSAGNNPRSDAEIWRTDLALAELAEPLGFESIWSVEHHFTRYMMQPDPLQFLTYMAGRTTTAKLGTMVCVLPWRDPVRVAENIIVLDLVSGGRAILGIGRGTGPVEFGGLNVEMETSRERFKEMTEVLLQGLETGVMEYKGEIIDQPRVELRPQPLATFKDRIFGASVSPESAKVMADLGAGILIIPQKPWEMVAQEIDSYRAMYKEATGAALPPAVVAGWTYVDENEERAREMAMRHIGDYFRSVVAHYGFDKPALKDTKGYEANGRMYEQLSRPGGMERMTEMYVNLKPWGTPEQVYEKIKGFSSVVGADHFVGVFRYAGMDQADGERNMRMFAKEVMPELRKLDVVPSAASV